MLVGLGVGVMMMWGGVLCILCGMFVVVGGSNMGGSNMGGSNMGGSNMGVGGCWYGHENM